MTEIIDISVPVRPGMVTYPGDPTVTLERVASLVNGDIANISRLAFGVHTGTHVDAPVHVDGGVRLVGIDYLSIGDEGAHHVLLAAGVVPIEGLDLRDVEPGEY